ncbi:MAG: DNA repair exonuclease [Gemmatimonadota bacterium]
MKILCTGDLHIGRFPTRLPADAPRRSLAVSERWSAIVDLAIAERIDVVALSGDLVDRANRFFEAYGPLESGVRRLAEAGITIVAVAGNHDFDVLPPLAENVASDRFHLIGRGGRWERTRVSSANGERLDVHGWSFPTERVSTDPLHGYDLEPDGALPTLGLLHCDLNASSSSYAPVSAAALRSRPPGLWLLGHLHDPRLHHAAGAADLLYPGSPQPLDPGEAGAHGVWVVETRGSDFGEPRFVPVATVRYEARDVDVAGLTTIDAVKARVVDQVEALREGVLLESGTQPEYLSIRLRLTGRTPLGARLVEREIVADAGDLDIGGQVRCAVDRVTVDTQPALDLDDLARAADAPGTLAALLVALRDGTDDEVTRALLTRTREAAEQVGAASAYLPLRARATASRPTETADVLRAQASLLLEELVGQKGSG